MGSVTAAWQMKRQAAWFKFHVNFQTRLLIFYGFAVRKTL
jgi:hypothetical protein